jgi:hypothetical protein
VTRAGALSIGRGPASVVENVTDSLLLVVIPSVHLYTVTDSPRLIIG